MEISDVRRKLRGAMDEAKRRGAERRTQVDEASRAWAERLTEAVVPAFHAVQSALTGEGYRSKVSTPGDAARLWPDHSAADFVEMALDTERDTPAVLVRSTRGRGRRVVSSERAIAEGPGIGSLSQDLVVAALIEELLLFIPR